MDVGSGASMTNVGAIPGGYVWQGGVGGTSDVIKGVPRRSTRDR